MIDSREVKEYNVSIREKWSGNGYKEEAAIERETGTESTAAKLNQESLHRNGILQMQVIF